MYFIFFEKSMKGVSMTSDNALFDQFEIIAKKLNAQIILQLRNPYASNFSTKLNCKERKLEA